MASKPSHFNSDDTRFMRYALSLAERGLGRCAPNPSVGCIIVKHDIILGAARTADGGRPHAETVALSMAGDKAQGATAYVTLEPCAHHGKTPPCAEALIRAGIKRVVIGSHDPDPRVSGRGIEMLENAGIEVITGVLQAECDQINKGFFLTQTEKRPFVTLKTAISADGKIALENGQSQWITGALARQKAHQLRSQHDAILVGINTVNHDDPSLTTRINGLVHKAVRVVVDSRLRIAQTSSLVQTAFNDPLWIIHASTNTAQIESLEKAGVRLFYCESMHLKDILNILSENGVTRLLVEGGAKLHSSFMKSGLYDSVAIFRSSKILGAGKDAFSGCIAEDVNTALQLQLKQTILLGSDRLDLYEK